MALGKLWGRVAALGVGLSLWVSGCNIYTESLLSEEDAGMESIESGECELSSCWRQQTVDGCGSYRPPNESDRPAASSSSQEEAPFYLAMDRIWVGETTPGELVDPDHPWAHYGFDLDGVCTNALSCSAGPQDATGCSTRAGIPFDGFGCVDNVLGRLLPVAAAALGDKYGIGEDKFNCELYRGGFSILFKVSGYNGELDDDDVRVDFYDSPGLATQRAWDCTDPARMNAEAPWIAIDRFSVAAGTLQGPTGAGGELPPSSVNSQHAYVVNGRLVAPLPDGSKVNFRGADAAIPGLGLRFHRGVLSARLELDRDGLWHAPEGVIGAMIKDSSLLESFAEIGLCSTSPDFQVLSTYILGNMDVHTSGTTDPSVECDAMSVAVAFTAREASAGPVVEAPAPAACLE